MSPVFTSSRDEGHRERAPTLLGMRAVETTKLVTEARTPVLKDRPPKLSCSWAPESPPLGEGPRTEGPAAHTTHTAEQAGGAAGGGGGTESPTPLSTLWSSRGRPEAVQAPPTPVIALVTLLFITPRPGRWGWGPGPGRTVPQSRVHTQAHPLLRQAPSDVGPPRRRTVTPREAAWRGPCANSISPRTQNCCGDEASQLQRKPTATFPFRRGPGGGDRAGGGAGGRNAGLARRSLVTPDPPSATRLLLQSCF